MTRYEQLISMPIEELAKWLEANTQSDVAPWTYWFDEKYCHKCSSIVVPKDEQKEKLGFEAFYNEDIECAYCEVQDECRFFPGRPNLSLQEIILMWLKEVITG